ncbi:hypothetical protein HDU79_009257 [Rhizoclosmatium sp. JEL0117]|nr:hypothetical protein HDU79_009257 [Rhizoclosmatium sp. JEL0117]
MTPFFLVFLFTSLTKAGFVQFPQATFDAPYIATFSGPFSSCVQLYESYFDGSVGFTYRESEATCFVLGNHEAKGRRDDSVTTYFKDTGKVTVTGLSYGVFDTPKFTSLEDCRKICEEEDGCVVGVLEEIEEGYDVGACMLLAGLDSRDLIDGKGNFKIVVPKGKGIDLLSAISKSSATFKGKLQS